MGGRGSGRKQGKTEHRQPSPEQLRDLTAELTTGGEQVPSGPEEFQKWLRKRSERDLWFFSRYILGNEYLGAGTFHRNEVCPFLTDFGKNRFKLLMLPMGHLKTTVASRSLPLHILIQPARSNLYFPGKLGRDCCILLANENEEKSKENLSVLKQHLQENELIYWLWPEVVWDKVKDAPLWTDSALTVPRIAVRAEASIRAVGIKTGFIGRYLDAIIGDDIAALEASQNPPLMERANKWRRAARTRFQSPLGIFIGVGTHWSSNDVYTQWKEDPRVELMIRSILETGPDGEEFAIWPENPKYGGAPWKEAIERLRTSTDPIEWALWFMNKPVPSGFTALNWNDLREYRVADDGATIYFEESEHDEALKLKAQHISARLGFRIGGFDPTVSRLRTGPPQSMSRDHYDYYHLKYPDGPYEHWLPKEK